MSDDDLRSACSPSEEMLLRAVRADVEPDRSGQQVGRFELLALLGRGGMGVVYRARDTTLGREVALKILTAAALADEGRRRRLLREARSGALADSPHIATVFEAGEAEGLPFLAMELVDGRTLREVLADKGGRLPVATVLDVARQLARGLAVAHAAEIVHRDLKPENVMIDATGTVKILDFGLAKLRAPPPGPASEAHSIEGLTHEGVVLGTPAYMSPEQGKGLGVDARSDVFSFGVVLYELLAGKRPFVGRTSVELLIAIDRDEPPPLTAREIPSALAELVRRCLSKDPAKRPAGGAALVDALDRLEAGSGVRRSLGRPLALAAVVVGAISVFTCHARRAVLTPAVVAPKSPLARDEAKLACPILAVEGVPEPNGWLGAAAASRACKRLLAALGQRSARVLVPAELLGLPHTPRDDFPDQPFDAPDVRARTLEAARKRADAWLDGKVVRENGTLRIELELHGSNGSIARASGADPRLHRAIARATDPLLRPDAIPLRETFDELAPLVWSREPALAVALSDYAAAAEAQDDLAWGLARIDPWRKTVLPAAPDFAFAEARAKRAPEPSIELEIDASSPARLLLTAGGSTSVAGRKKGIAALVAARKVEARPAVQRAYDLAIGWGLTLNGETKLGREYILPHVEADPIDVDWFVLALSALSSPKGHRTVAAFLAWAPENATAYDLPIEVDPAMAMAKRLEWTAKQSLLAPFSALAARKHVPTLVALGRTEEARMIGAAALVRPESAHTGNIVLAMLDVAEGKVGAAAQRLDETFAATEFLGGDAYADGLALTPWTDAHRAKGDLDEALDRLLTRFLQPKPVRASIVTPIVAPLAFACAQARSTALLLRCAGLLTDALGGEVVRDVSDDVRRMVRGLSAVAGGDLAKAAEEFRTLPPRVQLAMPIEPLDTPHDREMLLRNVDLLLATKPVAHTVPLLLPAIARWASARGDKKRARLAAQRVIDAWSLLDVTSPAVGEMRTILDRT